MLALLKFKKSVFSGVLDGGQDAVFLGGTRLKRFMESVETATGGLTPPTAAPSPEVDLPANGQPVAAAPAGAVPEQLWSDLATAGRMRFRRARAPPDEAIGREG